MNNLLMSLRKRRARIQHQIDEEQTRPAPDSLRLRSLKKLKLHLRERIEFLEHRSREGTIRMIPVVTRRALRFRTLQTMG
ncbi:YdcH family protein [Aurantimonas sp. VKM B-3413]|uniref:YdcH family protein n=1 Tax=Aurantimonas sp. VKM B-3413 TaxID=2779401 RepID=UPI001E333606|nr:YdcH family protein [Aurantimonas sp. VKM B-3413]MCB8839297.1 YdcH family protein [Aurantimonas sp. VKM B-3413]